MCFQNDRGCLIAEPEPQVRRLETPLNNNSQSRITKIAQNVAVFFALVLLTFACVAKHPCLFLFFLSTTMNVNPGAVAAVAAEAPAAAFRGQRFQKRWSSASAEDCDIPPHPLLEDKFSSEWAAVQFLVDNLILPWCDRPGVVCPHCEEPMGMKSVHDPTKAKVSFACFTMRCKKKECIPGWGRPSISIFKGTIFDSCRLPRNEVLHFFHLFALKKTHTEIKKILGWANQTVTDWMVSAFCCRQLCAKICHFFLRLPFLFLELHARVLRHVCRSRPGNVRVRRSA